MKFVNEKQFPQRSFQQTLMRTIYWGTSSCDQNFQSCRTLKIKQKSNFSILETQFTPAM